MSGIAMSKANSKITTESLIPAKPLLQKIGFRLGGLLIVFAIQMLLCRLMGMGQFGHYAVIMTVIGMLIVFTSFGFESVIQYFIPKYAEEPGLRKGLIRYTNRFIFLSSLITATGVFFFLLAFSKKFMISFSEAFFWAILMLPFISLLKHTDQIIRKLKGKKSAIPVTVTLPFITLIGSLWYFHENNKLPVDAVLMIAFLASVLLYVLFRSRAKRLLNHADTQPEYNRQKWTMYAGQFFASDVLNFLITNGGILLISYFLTNTQAGYFFITLKLSGFVAIAGSVVTTTSIPVLYEQYKSKQKKLFQQNIRNGVFRILSVALPAALILALSGKFVLGLFHEKVANEIWLLLILIAAQILNSVSSLNGKALIVAGKRNSYLVLLSFTLFIMIILGAMFIPTLKLTGASIAVFSASLFFFCASSVAVRK
jgi:O-antigen/teichoic acid export membrane protein